jgi:hypothetical protein
MKDSVLQKFATNRATEAAAAPSGEADGFDDFGAFGWLRGVRDRAIMLELRKRDGSVTVFGYAWLKKATFDPSGDIVLDFSGETVKITGRNLNAELRPHIRLLSGIARHRVPWIQEADQATDMEAPKGAVIIEELDVKA